VVLLGYYGNRALENDQKRRAFVELMSSRELADNNLRKDMFSKVIDQFIGQKAAGLEPRILNLELLAYNFHESIDLGPLLKQVYAESIEKNATQKQRWRLQRLAQDIVSREVDALSESACVLKGDVSFDELQASQVLTHVVRGPCAQTRELPAKWFNVDVMTNPQTTNLRVQTEVDVVLSIRPSANNQDQEKQVTFAVSPFDFPLIDNTRLDNRSRVSLVMTRVDDGGVTLTLVYFPGSRASVKDRPYQDEVIKSLEETLSRK
jgi:tellurite resistance-related uncharacterized protein